MATDKPNRVLWQPQPGPQTDLLTCPVGDILFGGARGGGKTSAMIGHFVQAQALYGKECRALWFRRSLPEVEGAQVQMLAILPQLGGVFQAQSKIWTMPNGATLKLRYLESDQDASRYQGWENSHLYFDELGTFARPEPIDMLRATLRSAAGVPTQMVASANPGGVGHGWIKARYVTPSPPMVPFVGSDGQQRVFIPSRLADNPALALADTTYVDRLKASGPAWLVRAWLRGDWDVEPDGAMLDLAWLQNTYDEPPLDRTRRATGTRVILSIDPAEDVGAANDETGIVIGALSGYPCHLLHAEAVKLLLDPLEKRIETLCKIFNPNMVLIEKKSVGGPLAQNLKRRPGWQWPVVATDPGQLSKAERLWAQAPWFEGGRVLFPSARAQALLPTVPPPAAPGTDDWQDYRRELSRFTGNKKLRERDNRVDATSQLLKHLSAPNLMALCA